MRISGSENQKYEEGSGLMGVSQHFVAVPNNRGVN